MGMTYLVFKFTRSDCKNSRLKNDIFVLRLDRNCFTLNRDTYCYRD